MSWRWRGGGACRRRWRWATASVCCRVTRASGLLVRQLLALSASGHRLAWECCPPPVSAAGGWWHWMGGGGGWRGCCRRAAAGCGEGMTLGRRRERRATAGVAWEVAFVAGLGVWLPLMLLREWRLALVHPRSRRRRWRRAPGAQPAARGPSQTATSGVSCGRCAQRAGVLCTTVRGLFAVHVQAAVVADVEVQFVVVGGIHETVAFSACGQARGMAGDEAVPDVSWVAADSTFVAGRTVLTPWPGRQSAVGQGVSFPERWVF